MKRARFKRMHRRAVLFALMMLAGTLPVAAQPDAAAQETALMRVGSPETGSSLEQVQKLLGMPDFVSGDILMYSLFVETGQEALPADLTLWFRSDALFFSSYSFPLQSDSEAMALHYSLISRELIGIHGEPSSRAARDGVYETEVWNLPQVDIAHTLILQEDRAEHTVEFTATR